MSRSFEPFGVDSRPHPWVAGIADLYMGWSALGAMGAFVLALQKQVIPEDALIFGLMGGLAVVLLYHMRFGRKLAFLSPGERLAGRRLNPDGTKIWKNPYRTHRGFLFALLLFELIQGSKTWDALGTRALPGSEVLGRSVWLFFWCWAAVAVGKGRLNWLLFFVFSHLFSLLAVRRYPMEQQSFIIGFLLLVTGLHLFALFFYRSRRQVRESAALEAALSQNDQAWERQTMFNEGRRSFP